MKKRLLCITLLLVLIIGTIPVSAKTKKSTQISNYLETSFDVEVISIVESLKEFSQMTSDELTLAINDYSKTATPYTIKAKKNGCLIVYCIDGYYNITDIHNKNKQSIANRVSYTSSCSLIPIRAKDKIAITYNTGNCLKMYIAFIPEEKIFSIDESYKKDNGTLSFKFGNVYGNDTVLSVYASKKSYSTKDILVEDLLKKSFENKTLAYDYTSVEEGEDAVLVLPNAGEYTIKVRLSMNGEAIAFDTFILDTDKYIEPKLDALDEPISAVKGTNIIVGYAEPYNNVFVEYDGNKYEGKANRKGIYKIVLKKDMKEGVAFKIWQSNDKGLTSKKAKYRVTDIE